MAKILLIETSTDLCSVALGIDGKAVSSRSVPGRRHASMTAVFCDEILRQAGLKASDLDAVCISDGPGSYTGLRVGVSTAKGLCFGAGIKLLSVSSLDILAAIAVDLCRGDVAAGVMPDGTLATPGQTKGEGPTSFAQWEGPIAAQSGSSGTLADAQPRQRPEFIVPMIDARRMEVFTAVYDAEGVRQSEIEARVIENGAFSDIAARTLFIGDGALKCRETIGEGSFVEAMPDARAMAVLAERQFAVAVWRDVAYFEPFYLKEFVATQSRKKMLSL